MFVYHFSCWQRICALRTTSCTLYAASVAGFPVVFQVPVACKAQSYGVVLPTATAYERPPPTPSTRRFRCMCSVLTRRREGNESAPGSSRPRRRVGNSGADRGPASSGDRWLRSGVVRGRMPRTAAWARPRSNAFGCTGLRTPNQSVGLVCVTAAIELLREMRDRRRGAVAAGQAQTLNASAVYRHIHESMVPNSGQPPVQTGDATYDCTKATTSSAWRLCASRPPRAAVDAALRCAQWR